ncbi:MAG: helix-turn-helix transcriptional regulator [Clostridia bacterium]|jgi:transcriptional regulator with XRE-family HTH domain|nr:helix-turn-helix transcriptional regulator [Clostridia bacterium]
MERNLEQMIRDNLKFEIEHSGRKKKEIAAALGISCATVSQYCSGRAQPCLATLSRLCSFLGVSADDVLCVEKE